MVMQNIKVVTVLKQRGYEISENKLKSPLKNCEHFHDFGERKKLKATLPTEKYSGNFEQFIGGVLESEFECPSICNVHIQGEGPGGDFDVLSINSSNELFYFECKTGNNVNKRDLESFYARHRFLKPEESVMIFDQSRSRVKQYLELMREILTTEAKKNDVNLAKLPNWQYSHFDLIPGSDREYAYHMNRNLFFCSGEDVIRGIRHIFREFYGVVKQTSYYS